MKSPLISVLTGDIINSRKTAAGRWLKVLKKELGTLGDSPKHWDVYRGDSFQAEVKNPADALLAAIRLKAALKSHDVDVRIAIGLGEKKYSAKTITESNGSAFIHSGELVEELKQLKTTMLVRSGHPQFDQEINLYLKLALVIMDAWTTNTAEVTYLALQYPTKSQEELGKLLKKKQNSVSRLLKRACYTEISELIAMYRVKVAAL
jgi:hypothetical protein